MHRRKKVSALLKRKLFNLIFKIKVDTTSTKQSTTVKPGKGKFSVNATTIAPKKEGGIIDKFLYI
jgi:hypothetical protein